MGGNSNFSSRFRYSGHLNKLKDYLPPCKSCFAQMRENSLFLKSNILCTNCVKWDMMTKSPLMSFDAPEYYPKCMLPDDKKLKPMEISFKILNETNKVCHEKFINGEWNERNVTAYSSVHCISNKGSLKIISHGNHAKKKKEQQENRKRKFPLIEEVDIIKNAEEFPDRYNQWKGGPYWNSPIKLIQFLDCLMHLLFLGIVKASRLLIRDWISKNKRLTIQSNIMLKVYETVPSMKLDWLKLIDLESGWVSDNYLAYCRVVKWINHSITRSNDSPENDIPTVQINAMIGSMLSMVAVIMEKKFIHNTSDKMDREIKLFLSNVDILYKSFQTQEKDPIWLRKFNFQSLLNIPYAANLYGPLVNLWEGSNQGEGYLRHVKPKITSVHTKKWNLNVHISLLNDNALNSVLDNHFTAEASDDTSTRFRKIRMERMKQSTMFYKYNNVDELFSFYKQHKAISFIMTNDNKYYGMIESSEKDKLGAVEIKFEYVTTIDSLSMHFHRVSMNCSINDTEVQMIDEIEIQSYLVMLPELGNDETNDYLGRKEVYYCIDYNWNEMDRENNLITPKSPFCKYI